MPAFIRASFPRVLALLAFSTLMSPATIGHAYPVIVDGLEADWQPMSPSISNLGRIVRYSGNAGEYVWFDVSTDERTDLASPDTDVDIKRVRVTADPVNLYFLVVMSDITIPGGPGSAMVQVAVDLDGIPGSGQNFLQGFSDTEVMFEARWEYLIHTRFGMGAMMVRTLDNAFNPVGGDPAAIDPGSNVIEFAVPWTRLGLGGPPMTPIRFTVVTFRSGPGDDTQDIGGPAISNVLDCVTNYGDPRVSAYPNTFDEVLDQVVHYAFDVTFESDGDPISPVLIGEAMVDAAGTESQTEWIELTNRTMAPLSLDGFRIGDEETPDAGEGMAAFPGGITIAPGDVAVVASDANAFMAMWGVTPDAEVLGTMPSVPDMSNAPGWSPTAPFQLGNAGDEILLLDRWDTVLDVLTWGGGGFPGVPARPTAPEGVTHERFPPDGDTDVCNVDFRNQALPSPGAAPSPAPDLYPGGLTAPVVRHGCRTFNVDFTVTSVGAPAGPFRVGVYVTGVSAELVASQIVSLTAGETLPVSLQAAIPPGYSGSLQLSVIADDLGEVSESDENNNVTSAPLTVPAPVILDVADVRNDQGRFVRVSWSASSNDVEGSVAPVLAYEIYRRIDPLPAPAGLVPGRVGPLSAQLAGWDYVASAPAHGESEYSVVVPTLADSNSSGVIPSVFLVRAATAGPTIYYDSCPDSGWSVDNLAPAPPQPLTGTYSGGGTALHWPESPEPDFYAYRLYRGTSAGFVPGPGNLVSEQPDTGYVDTALPSYYKLSAVDVNGNESGYVLLSPANTADVEDGLPRELALSGARPNPTQRAAAFTLALPRADHVRATVLDPAGRQVRELLSSRLEPGEHSLTWDLRSTHGARVGSGRYYLRITTGARTLTRSFVVLE